MTLPKFSYLWLPVLFLEAFIYYLSSIPGLELTSEPVTNFVTRKSAHITEYIILGFLIYRALGYKNKWLSFFLTFLLAASDEYHQSFVPHRTGKISDLAYDIAGIYIGISMPGILRRYGIFYKKRRGD